MVKVSKYLKNVTKSMGYALYSVTKDNYSTMTDFAETNSDLFKAAYSDLKNYKTTYQRVMTQFKNSKVFVASKLAVQSIKEDLKTGDFYNKARQDAFATKYSGIDLSEDDFDISDFGFDEDSDWDINDGDTLVSKVVSRSNKLSSILISDTIIKTSSAQIETNKEIASMQYAQNIELTKSINKNIENLGMNLDNRMKDFAQMSKINSENAVKFYDNVGKTLNQIATDIKFLADTERKRQDPKFGEKEKTKKPGQNIEDIAPNGIVDLRAYGKKIKSNAKNMLNQYFPGMEMLFGDNNMLAMLAANPMQLVSESVVKKMLTRQNELLYNLDNLNKSLEGFFPALMGRMNTLAEKDEYSGGKKTWQLLGQLFGIKNKYTTKIDTKQFNRGATAWDGVSKKYLEEVIPYYLRKMTAALTGDKEMIFDPENGRWTTVSGAVKAHAQQQFQRSQSAFSEFNSELNYFLKDTRFKRGADARRLREELPILYKVLYSMGDIDLKGKSGSELGVSDETLNIFRAAFEAMPNSVRMNIVSNMNTQKKQASDQLKQAEELGTILAKFAAENIDLNRYDHRNSRDYKIRGIDKDYTEYGTYKVKGKLSPISMSIVDAKDKYDKSIFDYLKGIKDEMENFRLEGMYVYGNIGGSGGGGGRSSRRRTYTYRQNEINERLNFKYEKQKSDSERELEARNNRDEAYERNIQAMMAKDDAWKYTFVDDFSEEGSLTTARNSMYNTAKKRQEKQKQDWLDERQKDSVFRDIFGITQDIVHRKKFDQYKDKNFSEKFEHADTFGEKFFLVKDEVESWLDKPSAALNRAVLAADNHLYNMLYKSSMKMVDDDGKPIEGFLDLLKFEAKKTFTDVKETISDWFGNARQKYKESAFGQWMEDLKEKILGSQTGEGHRDKFFPALMDALKKNSEDVFNMYKEAFRKSALDSGIVNEDEDGNLTFKSQEQTEAERYAEYEREYMRHAKAQGKLAHYDKNKISRFINMDSETRAKLIERAEKTGDTNLAKIFADIDAAAEADKFFAEFEQRRQSYTGDQRLKYDALNAEMNKTKSDINEANKGRVGNVMQSNSEAKIKANAAAGNVAAITNEINNLNEIIKNEKGIYSAADIKQAKADLKEAEKDLAVAEKEKEKAVHRAKQTEDIYDEYSSEGNQAIDSLNSYMASFNDNFLTNSIKKFLEIQRNATSKATQIDAQIQGFKDLEQAYEDEISRLDDAISHTRNKNKIEEYTRRQTVIAKRILPAIQSNISMLSKIGGKLYATETVRDVNVVRNMSTEDLEKINLRQSNNTSSGKNNVKEKQEMSYSDFDPSIISELELFRDRSAMFRLIEAEYGDGNGNIDESKLNNKQKDALKGFYASQKRIQGLTHYANNINDEKLIGLIKQYTRAPKEANKKARAEYEKTAQTKFTEFKNLKDEETPTMARGGINKTGRAFRSIVSSGEFINGRMVPPGGPYITTIPKNGVVINPNSESTIRRQAQEEKKFARGLRRNAAANDGLNHYDPLSGIQMMLADNFNILFQKLDVLTGEDTETDVLDRRISDRFADFINDPQRIQDALENPLAFAMSTIISDAVPRVTRTINDRIIPWVDAKLRRGRGQDEDLAMNAEANDNLKSMVPKELQDAADAIGKNIGINGLAKGILGMGAGGILLGMPLLGAGIGMGSEILKNNDNLNSALFGTILGKDENGNVVRREYDGIISEAMQKAFPDAKAYGLTGSILGLLTPLGPLGGLLVGAGLGFAKNTEVVQEGLFGPDKIFSEENRAKLRKAIPNLGIGAAAGALALGGPFGLLGGTLLGAGAGLVSSTDKFKDIMFGEDDGTGKRQGGIMGAVKDQVLTPMKDFALEMADKVKHTLLDDFLKPLVDLVPLLTEEFRHFVKDTVFAFPRWVKEKLDEGLLNPISNLVRDKLINPAKRILGGVVKGALGVLTMPFKAVGRIATGLGGHITRKQIRQGRSKLSAAERNQERKKHGLSFFMHNLNPLDRDRYAEFDEELEGLSDRSSIGQLEDLQNTIYGNIGDSKAFKKALMANQRKTSKEISDKFKTTFVNGTANQIEKLIRKGDSESMAKAADLIRNSDTVNGQRLSKQEADALINKVTTFREERDNIEAKMESYMGKSDEDLVKIAQSMGFKGIKNGKLSKNQKQKLAELIGTEISAKKNQKKLMGDEAYSKYEEEVLNTAPVDEALDKLIKSFEDGANAMYNVVLRFDNIVGETRQSKLESANGYENITTEGLNASYKTLNVTTPKLEKANRAIEQIKNRLNDPNISPEEKAHLQEQLKAYEGYRDDLQKKITEAENRRNYFVRAKSTMENKKAFNSSKMQNAKVAMGEVEEEQKEKYLQKYFEPIAASGYYNDKLTILEEHLSDPLYELHAKILLKITKKHHKVEELDKFFKIADESWLNRVNWLGKYADIREEDIQKLQVLSDADMRSLADYLKTDPDVIHNNDIPKLRQFIHANKNKYENADLTKVANTDTHSLKGQLRNFRKSATKAIGDIFGYRVDADAREERRRKQLIAEIRHVYDITPDFKGKKFSPEQLGVFPMSKLESYREQLRRVERVENAGDNEITLEQATANPSLNIDEPLPANAFANKLLTPFRDIKSSISQLVAKRKAKRAAKRKKLHSKLKSEFEPQTFTEKALEVIAENTALTAEAVDDVVEQQDEQTKTPAKGSKEEADARLEEEHKMSFFDRMKDFFGGGKDDDDEKKPSLFSRIKSGIANVLGKALFGISVFGGVPILVGFTKKYVIPFFKEKVAPWLIGTKNSEGDYEGGVLSPIVNGVKTGIAKLGNWFVETGWPALKSELREFALESIDLWKEGIDSTIDFTIGKVMPKLAETLVECLPDIIWAGIKGGASAFKRLFGKKDYGSNEEKIDTSASKAYNGASDTGNSTSKSDMKRKLDQAATNKTMGFDLVDKTASIVTQNKNAAAYQDVNANAEDKAAREQYLAENYDLENNESYQNIKDSDVNETYAYDHSGMSLKEQGGRMLVRSIVTGGKEVRLLGGGLKLTGKSVSKVPMIGRLAGAPLKALGSGVQGIGKLGGTIKALGGGKTLSNTVGVSKAKSAAAARKAATKKSTKLATKIGEWIKKHLTNLLNNPRVQEKTAELGTKSAGRLSKLFGKISDKLVPILEKLPLGQLAKILGKIAVVVTVVLLVADFITGWDDAASILGIVSKQKDLLTMEKLLGALSRVISNQLLFGFVSDAKVADWIIGMDEFVKFGGEVEDEAIEDIKKRRDEAEETIEAYNIANGTSFESVEEINRAVNTTVLQKAHNKVSEFVENLDKSAIGGYKQYEELRQKADAGSKWAKFQLGVRGFTDTLTSFLSLGLVNDTKRYKAIYAKEHADELAGLLEDTENPEEVATNAKADDNLTKIKTLKTKTAKAIDPLARISTSEMNEDIAAKLKRYASQNKATRNKIAKNKITIASKDYWKINVGDDNDYASSLFKLSEFTERAIKAPILAVQNVIDSVVSSETGISTRSTTSSSSQDNITSSGSTSTTSSANNTTTKKYTLKTTLALGVGLVKSLLGGKGLSGTGKQYFHGLKHKYAVTPIPLTNDDASFIKSQYSGGGHLYQRDYNDRFNIAGDSSAQTIADSGCGPVVASELLSRYGKNYNVHEAARAALKYKERDGGTFPEYFHDYLGSKGVKTSNINSQSELRRRIKSGESVILMGQSGRGRTPFGTTNPHYVLATGMSNGKIVIQDPEDPMGNALYNANDTINDSIYAIGTSGMGRRFGFGRRLSGKGPALTDSQKTKLISFLHEITLSEEAGSDYTAVCGDDEGSMSFGSMGFHATLAKQVLEQIAQRVTDPTDKATLQKFAKRSEKEVFEPSDCNTLKDLLNKYSDINKEVQDSMAMALIEENNLSHPLKMYNSGRLNNPLSMLIPADIYNTGYHNGWAEDYNWKSTATGDAEIDQVLNQMLSKSWWATCGSRWTSAWMNRMKRTAERAKAVGNIDNYVPGKIIDGYTGLSGSLSGSVTSTSSSSSESKSSGLLGLFKNYATTAFKKLYGSSLVTMLFGDETASSTSSTVTLGDGGYEGAVNENGADAWFLETLAGSRVSSGYRPANRPEHAGIDYAAGTGTPIYCPVDGVVNLVEDNGSTPSGGGYGYLTIVEDTHGYFHIFGHQCQFPPVKQGQEVVRGDLVGYVGDTGDSDGAHLHYQVNRSNDKWHADIDPNSYDYSDYIKSANIRANKKAYENYEEGFVGPVMPVSGKGKKNKPQLIPGHVTVNKEQLKAIQKKTLSDYEKKKKGISAKGVKSLVGNTSGLTEDSQNTPKEKKMSASEARKHIGGPSTINDEVLATIVKLLGNISTNTYNLNEVVALLSKLSITTAQTVTGSGKKSGKGTQHKDDTQATIEELVRTLAKTNSMNMNAFSSLNSKIDGNNSTAMQAVYSIAGQ